ncbi:hypothetical protein C2L64_50050 [Paraburkholderia hospita]|uniref:Uncharacterized protein n=1 Tax=Paraburkholderia hospita TaxID=169430 RepID=A0AAN1MRF7_9BURK|nr:hypothetical protein C2L64_50050 [Paraburkholderia hospita]
MRRFPRRKAHGADIGEQLAWRLAKGRLIMLCGSRPHAPTSRFPSPACIPGTQDRIFAARSVVPAAPGRRSQRACPRRPPTAPSHTACTAHPPAERP